MIGLKFVTISDLDKSGPPIIAEAEHGKKQIIITRRGKPRAILRKVAKRDTGIKQTLTDLTNNANRFLSEIEKRGVQIIITRNGRPVLLLKRISDKAFYVRE